MTFRITVLSLLVTLISFFAFESESRLTKFDPWFRGNILPIQIVTSDIRPGLIYSIEAASLRWNSLVGKEVFILGPQPIKKCGLIWVYSTSDRQPTWTNRPLDAYTEFGRGNHCSVSIHFVDLKDIAPWYEPIAFHELGHALGFEHNRDPRHIMHPAVRGLGRARTLLQGELHGVREWYRQGSF